MPRSLAFLRLIKITAAAPSVIGQEFPAVIEPNFLSKNGFMISKILLSTGEKRIVETATVDNEVNRRWGEVNGVGQNWLGLILMEVRAELRGHS